MTEAPTPHPLRLPAFRAYFAARLALTLGITSLVLVIGWQVYGTARETMSIKESAFLLGLVGLAQFAPLFHPRLRAWSGTPEQVRAAADAFGVFYDRVQPAGSKPGFYLMNHTTTIFLLDAAGCLVGKLDSHLPLDESLAMIRTVL